MSTRTSRIPATQTPVPLVAALREKLRLSRKVMARVTGVSEQAIADWEVGQSVSAPGLRRLREFERFHDRLAEVVKAEAIPAWLEAPNPGFEGLSPLDGIERGDIERLWRMLFYLESGVAS